MNTTFTTCAEKKAKQFLNLLQGYTKGIRITAILILLLMGVSNAWAWNVEQDKVFYFKPSSVWKKDDARFAVAFGIEDITYAWQSCIAVSGETDVYYVVSPGNYDWMIFCRMEPNTSNDWGNKWNESQRVQPNNNYNRFDLKADWATDFNWYKYAPPMESASITTTSTVYGGDGTQGNPYQIKKGTKISVSATATSTVTADNQTKYYKFYKKENSGSRTIVGSESTTTTSSFTASSTVDTEYAVDVEARNEYYGTYGEKATSSTLYFITIEPIYAILGSFNDWTHSANTWDLSDQGSYNWKATFHLDKGSHTFKVVYNSSYYGRDKTTITRASATASSLSTSGANINLTTDIAGDYTFTFNSSTKNLTVTYPTAYTLTYGSGAGGSGTVTANNSIKSGDLVLAGTSVSLTATPASGYDFAAWYSDQACEGAAISSNNPYNFFINSNTTLYAKWKALSFELTWDLNGGRITKDGTPKGQVETGTPLIAPTVEKDHYDHSGWSPEVPAVMPGEDVTYTAQWTPKKYTITYNLNGGSGTMTPTTYTIESETFALPNNPTKTGSTFAGWYDNSEFNGEAITTIASGSTGDKEFWAKWNIGTYDVTLDMEGGNGGTASVNVAYGAAMPTITIPTKNDHLFDGYYDGDNGTGIKYYNADGTSAKNWDKETATLYAKWIPYSQCIFFKNNLNWSDVYVYFYSSDKYWDGDKGTGSKKEREINGSKAHYREFRDEMTNITGTDIWYLDYKTMATNVNATYAYEIENCTNIAFTKDKQYNYEFFDNTEVVRRGDFNHDMQLFVPLLKTKQTADEKNKHDGKVTKYYSSGIWMKYNSTESGYDWRGATSEDVNNAGWNNSFAFTASNPGGYSFKASVTFNNINQHFFKIHNIKNDWFGNGGTMDQNNCTNWIFGSDNGNNAKITPTITGTYIFTIYLGDGEVSVSLDYPLSVGDYRLAYEDNTKDSYHPGHYLKKHSETQTDTVSFFIHHDQEPVIFVEQCTEITDGEPTWTRVNEITTNPAASITESGVYNFSLQQIEGQTLPVLVDEAMPYTGDYYIRTDAAEGGWDSFRQKSNQITYSSFADAHSNFNHYYCKYIEAGRNVKFTIANDYSYCISDTLDNDAIILPNQSSPGCLPINANVRFGWDSNTNEISRAYIKGAGQTSDRFLVLQGNEHLKDANGKAIPKGTGVRTGLEANEEILVDQQNWIYQVDVTANNATLVKLIAEYNGTTQYFKGDDKEYTRLLSSSATKNYKIRLVYDFKSNHLVIAWLAGGNTVANTEILGADMMVIRKDQNQADQLNFNPQNSSMMNSVKTGYAVMTFTKDHILDNDLSERERSLYWVSFPFDVKISDVFGFGEYAEHWIIQYYDGEERAEKGLFSDSGTYWKYIFDTDTVLHAGEGYVLVLDLNKIEFLHGAEEVSLYFPSTNPLTTITGNLPTEARVPEHWCNIDREWKEGETTYHHRWTDSHWNLIGVPGFADINFDLNVTKYHFMQDDASFYYNFNLAESTYAVEASQATEFQAMYAYMVQFAGTIDWTSSTVVGATPTEPKLAARRYSDEQPEKVVLRLELAQGEEVADRTFVQMQQEGATANFDLSLDLTKIMNSGFSNIYTLTDSLKIQVAGNALPMEETVVPVGVNIATAGEYTFRMPDGTEGMVVELIDYETNTRTNLLLSDYTVNLPAGSNETRFALSIKPEKTATNVGNIGGTMNDGQGVRKFIIDGKLYLQKDGMLYDAQGHIVR